MSFVLDAPAPPQGHPKDLDPTFHLITVVPLDGQFWAICSCSKWKSLPQMSELDAQRLTCAVEDAELDGLRNDYLYRRALVNGH